MESLAEYGCSDSEDSGSEDLFPETEVNVDDISQKDMVEAVSTSTLPSNESKHNTDKTHGMNTSGTASDVMVEAVSTSTLPNNENTHNTDKTHDMNTSGTASDFTLQVDFFGLNQADDDQATDMADTESYLFHVRENHLEDFEFCVVCKGIKAKSEKLEKLKKVNKQQFTVPDSDFWKGNLPVDDWSNPESVWHTRDQDPITPNYPITNSRTGGIVSYQSKKQKLESHSESSSNNSDQLGIESNSGRSMYYVHHKVAPFLYQGQRQVCRPATKKLVELPGHSGTINRIEWCSSQFSHLLLSASMDTSVRIWNAFSTTSPCVRTIRCHSKAVKDATWSSSGRQIISCGYDRTARVSDVETAQQVCMCDHTDYVSCARYHPVNHHVFVTGSKNILLCWDQRYSSKPIRKYTYKDVFGQVQDVAFCRNGSQFFSCSDLVARDSADRNIMAWDFQSGVVLSNQVYQERYTCTRLKVHPHQPQLLAQTQGDYLAQFSTIRPYKMNKCKRFESHKVLGYNIGFDFSPDGSYVASGSSDGSVTFYDFQLARVARKLHVGKDNVCLDVAWHPVLNSTLALCTWSGILSVWH